MGLAGTIAAIVKGFGDMMSRVGLLIAFGVLISAVFPSIYGDVQLILAAPLARSAAPTLGRDGLAVMAGTLTAGILCGYAIVVPSLVTVTLSDLVGAHLVTLLLYGLVVGPLTAAGTVLIWRRMVGFGFWHADRDEATSDTMRHEEEISADAEPAAPLVLALVPILLPLMLIAAGATAQAWHIESSALTALGTPGEVNDASGPFFTRRDDANTTSGI